MAKKNAAPTKSEILATISKETELSKKQVGAVFDSLSASIKKSLRSHGLFTLPGLLKMKVVKKPATKAREGINPFNGEKMMFKAKPASKKVRIAALKTLKELVNWEWPASRPGRFDVSQPLRSALITASSSSARWPWKKCPTPGMTTRSGAGVKPLDPGEHALRVDDVVRIALHNQPGALEAPRARKSRIDRPAAPR